MRFLFTTVCLVCLAASALAQPKAPPVLVDDRVTSLEKRVAELGAALGVKARPTVGGPGCVCGDGCDCPTGTCPSKCPVASSPGTLRTTSGRLIRATATGYVYADERESQQVLDCSSGKCRWVDAPKSAVLSPVNATSGPSCPNGQCGVPQSPGRFQRYTFPVK